MTKADVPSAAKRSWIATVLTTLTWGYVDWTAWTG